VKIRQAITGRRSDWRLKLSFTFGAGQNAATQRNRRSTMAGGNTLVRRALCALSAAWQAIAPAGAQEIDTAVVAAYFDAAMAMERIEHPIAGAVVAVVRGDELIFSWGYGYAKLDADVNPRLHAALHAGDRRGCDTGRARCGLHRVNA